MAGAVLISPWTNLFPADTPQARYNETSDMIVIGAGRRWSALFLGKVVDQKIIYLLADVFF